MVHLRQQFGHAGSAARTVQATRGHFAQARLVHGDAAGVIAAVLQPLQALHQDGNDIAGGYRADDAAHKYCSNERMGEMLGGLSRNF